MTLYRVWFDRVHIPQYELVEAEDTDSVYRSFRKQKRSTITRVDEVLPTSEWDRRRAAGELPQPRRRSRVRA